MSVDQYQRTVNGLDKEIADLEKKKAAKDKDIASLQNKIVSTQKSINKNTSQSSLNSNCYIFLLNSPQTLENLCVNPLFRTGDNLTGNFKEEYNTY